MSTPADLNAAFAEILRVSRPDGRGRVFAVTSGISGAGTSFVTTQLALIAATSGFECALIDMDLTQNAQFETLQAPDMQNHYGALAGPYDASFGMEPFWRVTPSVVNDEGVRETDAAFVALYQTCQGKLSVTRFLWDKLGGGQAVHLAQARPYWHALRERFALSFVDVPSSDQGGAGSTIYGEVDGVIMVTGATNAAYNQDLLSQVTQSNGKCIGAIINAFGAQPQYGDSA